MILIRLFIHFSEWICYYLVKQRTATMLNQYTTNQCLSLFLPPLFPKAPGSMVQGLWGSFTNKEFSKYDFLRLAKIVHGLYKMVHLFSSLDLLWLSQSKTPAPAAWINFLSMLFHCSSLLFDSPQICGRCGSGGYQFLWLLRKKRGEVPLPCE